MPFHAAFLLSCPSDTPITNTTSPKASRALEDHLQLLLTRAVAPSHPPHTSQGSGGTLYFISPSAGHMDTHPSPGPITQFTLFATHLSRTLQANTIQVYVQQYTISTSPRGSAVPLPTTLAVRGIQRSQDPSQATTTQQCHPGRDTGL